MTRVNKSEQELLRQYLNKNHAFRHKQSVAQRRGLVVDKFGANVSEADNGFRNFSAFFGAANVHKGEWSRLDGNDYLWAYGAGGGTYTSANNVTTTANIAAKNSRAVFTMLFGSYFGDWDATDSLLRAPLATTTYGLSSVWGGRPDRHFHHMALGQTLGFGMRFTQSSAYALLHTALMGDPTLRLHPVAPPSDLVVTRTDYQGVDLDWDASPDTDLVGYHVYRAASASGPFARVNSALVEGTSFKDGGVLPGTYTYLVRAVKWETPGGGTYFNPSQGVFTTATYSFGTGMGLKGEYFDNKDLTSLKTTRTDAIVQFDWGTGNPAGLTSPDSFSARWTGEVEAVESGTYTFSTVSDDGVRLWVNGQLLINRWTNHSPQTDQATIPLEAGKRYAIKMEYFENGGGAVAKLRWKRPGQTTGATIPQKHLYP